MQIVLCQRVQRLVSLLRREVRACDDVLVDANSPVHLPTSPEKAAEREMGFDRLVVDADHFEKMFQRLIGLFVEQEVQPFQVIDIERRGRLLFVALAEAAHGPPCRRKQQKEAREQERRFSRHRTMAGCAGSLPPTPIRAVPDAVFAAR